MPLSRQSQHCLLDSRRTWPPRGSVEAGLLTREPMHQYVTNLGARSAKRGHVYLFRFLVARNQLWDSHFARYGLCKFFQKQSPV
eukprot:2789423-Alexandrium_andersonii.AAC.1